MASSGVGVGIGGAGTSGGALKRRPTLAALVAETIVPKVTPEVAETTAAELVDRFLQSEEVYVERGLRVLAVDFEKRLKASHRLGHEVISDEKCDAIFANVTDIYGFHQRLLDDLQRLRIQSPYHVLEALGSVFIQFTPFLKMYARYIRNFAAATALLGQLQTKRQAGRWRDFLQLNEACCGHELQGLLGLPVHRFPQYTEYLNQIHKAMARDAHCSTTSVTNVQTAVAHLEAISAEVTVALRDQKARDMVVTVQEQIFKGTVDLMQAHRLVVRLGDLRMKRMKAGPRCSVGGGFKSYFVVLFNDLLVYGTRPAGLVSGGHLKRVLVLDDMMVRDSLPGSGQEAHGFTLSSPHYVESLVFFADNDKDRERWCADIRRTVEQHMATGLVLAAGVNQESVTELERMVRKEAGAKGVRLVQRKQAPAPEKVAAVQTEEILLRQGEAQWGDWVMLLDDDTGEYYFENLATEQTQWEPPPNFPHAIPNHNPVSLPPALTHDAEDEIPPWLPVQGDWEQILDEESGDYYYENLRLALTQWDVPDEFVLEDEHEERWRQKKRVERDAQREKLKRFQQEVQAEAKRPVTLLESSSTTNSGDNGNGAGDGSNGVGQGTQQQQHTHAPARHHDKAPPAAHAHAHVSPSSSSSSASSSAAGGGGVPAAPPMGLVAAAVPAAPPMAPPMPPVSVTASSVPAAPAVPVAPALPAALATHATPHQPPGAPPPAPPMPAIVQQLTTAAVPPPAPPRRDGGSSMGAAAMGMGAVPAAPPMGLSSTPVAPPLAPPLAVASAAVPAAPAAPAPPRIVPSSAAAANKPRGPLFGGGGGGGGAKKAGGGGGGVDDLLAAIRAGKALKKTPKPTEGAGGAVPSAAAAGGGSSSSAGAGASSGGMRRGPMGASSAAASAGAPPVMDFAAQLQMKLKSRGKAM